MNRSQFRSDPMRGRRITLSFERISDSFWTEAVRLRELVAEMDRLGVGDKTPIQLKHRTDADELGPVGWSLNLTIDSDNRGAA